MKPDAMRSHTPAPAASREQVMQALQGVVDPELGMSIVDLGLVYGVALDAGHVRITVTLTAPGCPLQRAITDWVVRAVGKIPGVEKVDVSVTFDPPWSPDRIRANARS